MEADDSSTDLDDGPSAVRTVALLPDAVYVAHVDTVCGMLARMEEAQVREWFSRVVLPLWTRPALLELDADGDEVRSLFCFFKFSCGG
jgi:hypothetical protein